MASTITALAYKLCCIWLWDQRKRRKFKRAVRKSGKLKPRNRNYTIPTHFSGRFMNHGQLGNDVILQKIM